MTRLLVISFALIVLLAGGATIYFANNTPHRIIMIQRLCEAGLPNLSRPPEVSAEQLGCAVLGPRLTVTGFAEFGFELSRLTLGDRYKMDGGQVINERAWLEGTDSVLDRGWRPLMDHKEWHFEECGTRVAKVTAEGWMTVSSGAFGHIDIEEPRAFFAYRIITSRPATTVELAGLRKAGASVCPTGDTPS